MTKEKFINLLKGTNLKMVDTWIQEDKLNRDNKWINFIVSK